MTDDSRATFTLRASRALLDRLKHEADEHSHSMNAEIIHRLEQSLQIGGLVSTIKSDDLNPEESLLIKIWHAMSQNEKAGIMGFLKAFMDRKLS